jgi:hypothetical protein
VSYSLPCVVLVVAADADEYNEEEDQGSPAFYAGSDPLLAGGQRGVMSVSRWCAVFCARRCSRVASFQPLGLGISGLNTHAEVRDASANGVRGEVIV